MSGVGQQVKPRRTQGYSTQYYWHIIFPIILFIVAAVWLAIIMFYPAAADDVRVTTATMMQKITGPYNSK
jgi:TM2 domain-containing membrane protein YozV